MVVGGCYPFVGSNPSCIDNAYQHALSQIDWQATQMGANAVIGLRTIQADQFYVLVTGTAIWVDAQERILPTVPAEGHARTWGFVWRWTRDL